VGPRAVLDAVVKSWTWCQREEVPVPPGNRTPIAQPVALKDVSHFEVRVFSKGVLCCFAYFPIMSLFYALCVRTHTTHATGLLRRYAFA